jgi:hypothetical protein
LKESNDKKRGSRVVLFIIGIVVVSYFVYRADDVQEKPESTHLVNEAVATSDGSTATPPVDPTEEKKAYDKVYFGMSRSTYNKVFGKTFKHLGNRTYSFDPYFNGKKGLYQLDIAAESQSASYYDTRVRDDMDNLVDIITSKYGQPNWSASYPDFLDMQAGLIHFCRNWYIGDKKIQIGVGEREATYYAICRIYSDRMTSEIEDNQAEKINQKVKKDASGF